MKKFRIVFQARKAGALGLPSQYDKTVAAETEDAARLKLYDHFDHIRVFKIQEV